MKKANPKSFHAFWVFEQILQRGRPFGCALGVLVAAAGAPVTVVDVCKAKSDCGGGPETHLHAVVVVITTAVADRCYVRCASLF